MRNVLEDEDDATELRPSLRQITGPDDRPLRVPEALELVLRPLRTATPVVALGTRQLVAPPIRVAGIPLGPIATADALERLAKRASDPNDRNPPRRFDDDDHGDAVRFATDVIAWADRKQVLAWEKVVAEMLDDVAAQLGIVEKVEARLLHASVYAADRTLCPHRDRPKFNRQVASLVVVLPSDRPSRLGLAIVDQEEVVEIAPQREKMAYCAWFGDRTHTLGALDETRCAVLEYAIVRTSSASLATTEIDSDIAGDLRTMLSPWPTQTHWRRRAVYGLRHHYTDAELRFGNLRGADVQIAAQLVQAARACDCEVYLAKLIHVEEHHDVTDGGKNPATERFGKIRVERRRTISIWTDVDDRRVDLPSMTVGPHDFAPVGVDEFDGADALTMTISQEDFDDLRTDMPTTRSRAVSALVLWPRNRIGFAWCASTSSQQLGLLEYFADSGEANLFAREKDDHPERVLTAMSLTVDRWRAEGTTLDARQRHTADTARLLHLLRRLGAIGSAKRLLRFGLKGLVVTDELVRSAEWALNETGVGFRVQHYREMLNAPNARLTALFIVLADWVRIAALPNQNATLELRGALRDLLRENPRDPKNRDFSAELATMTWVTHKHITPVLKAIELLADHELADWFVDLFASAPSVFAHDRVVGHALRELLSQSKSCRPRDSALAAVYLWVTATLEQQIATPPAPRQDWRFMLREDSWIPEFSTDFQEFLNDPDALRCVFGVPAAMIGSLIAEFARCGLQLRAFAEVTERGLRLKVEKFDRNEQRDRLVYESRAAVLGDLIRFERAVLPSDGTPADSSKGKVH